MFTVTLNLNVTIGVSTPLMAMLMQLLGDPEKIQELTDKLKASGDALSAAVAANAPKP
jgi:hypothetical protein